MPGVFIYMIRLRKIDGEETIVPKDNPFIEIVDVDNKLLVVLFQRDDGSIKLITSAVPEASKYTAMFGAKNLIWGSQPTMLS